MLNILSEKNLTRENYSVTSCIIGLDRGFLILVTDQKNFGIGNVVLSAPPILEGTKSMSAPAPLFGLNEKRNVLSKIISELCAKSLRSPCLVMVHIKGLDRKDLFVSKCVIEILKQTLNEVTEKKN
ncbi:MAG: hypothetical protein ACTSWY_13005 [Promethearchaeota archaeon]